MSIAAVSRGSLRYQAQRFLSWFDPPRVLGLLGVRGVLKMVEVKLLGRYASTYCYNPPDTVFLELTNRCQIKCAYCYRYNVDLMNPEQGFMSYDQFTRAVVQIRGVRRLYLSWGGECTLHKDLVPMLRFVRERRIAKRFGIVSNGMLLRPPLADRILATGVSSIAVSLDGSDKQAQESMRKGSDFGVIIENLRYLAEHAGPETEISVTAVVTTRNLESMEALPDLLKKIGVRRLAAQAMLERTEATQGIRIENPVHLVAALVRKCNDAGIRFSYDPMPARTVCLDPFRTLGITWDGRLTPCCNIATDVLREDAFARVGDSWNGPEIRTWRKRILRRNYPAICHRNCKIAPRK